MAQFKPVMIDLKEKLKDIDKKEGQYIIVVDKNEVYVDKLVDGEIVREKVSQNIYSGTTPNLNGNYKDGDIWIQTEDEE